ncbi:MAG: PVC-type heme-binding CxxCH protein [Fimbriiglobus sp.]
MRLAIVLALLAMASSSRAAEPLKVMFLGDGGHHQPAARFAQLQPVLAARGIELTYTDTLDSLTAEKLKPFDGLMIFANHDRGTAEHVRVIQEFVRSGKGFIPLHCASFCFTNNEDYIKLVGGQFRSHTTGVFRTKPVAEHPILKGFQSFESWDETYVHHKHNPVGRTVLEVRGEKELDEPWTWVREEGKGRVFYTAWGHDQRTWSHPGFHALVERGTRWACGQTLEALPTYTDAPKMTKPTGELKTLEYQPAKIPFYPPSKTWGTLADPKTTMQKPLPPEESIKHYSTPQDFEMQLFAADADFQGGKPMAMTWDERGRLWAAVTVDYPNEMQTPGQGRDKIVILEDTNGDGRADKFTVFAEKLSIPTALLCAHGGLIVHQAPDTLFLKDTDGDGVADLRQVLFTGWDTKDTHAGPSNLRYGFDNWFYGSVGYSGFNGTVNAERLNFRQGYYRFQIQNSGKELNVTKLEFLRSTNNNTWGFTFDEQGRMFGSTANGCPLVHLAIPNRYYEKVRGLTPGVLPNIAFDNAYHPISDKVRQVDWHNGFTSAANCAIYTARTYPQEYWNRAAFVSDPTGHLTATFQLQAVGSDFVARYGWNLVAGQEEWIAPIDAQVGPDGMVWVLDWYNYIVQHNPTPQGFKTGKGNAYETDLRDKKHGRVYRVVYKNAKPELTPKLGPTAKPGELVLALKHSNLFWRLHAHRLIVERRINLGDELKNLLQNEFAATHVRHLPGGQAVAKPATDELSALLELSDKPTSPEIGERLLKRLVALKPLTDKNLADATIIAAAAHAEAVLTATTKSNAFWTPTSLAALEKVAATYASTAPTTVGVLLPALAAKVPAGDAAITGILAAWPKANSPKLTVSEQAAFKSALPKASVASRGRLLKLGVAWGVTGLEAEMKSIVAGLVKLAADESQTEASRLTAAQQAIELQPTDTGSVLVLLKLLNTQSTPDFAGGVLDALSASQASNLGTELIAKLKQLPTSARAKALRIVLARPEATKAFLDAVEAGSVRFDSLALDQKTALAAHPDTKLAARAKKLLAAGGGLPDANRQKVIDEYHPILAKTGDLSNGKKMFTNYCAKCHKHGAEGQVIGPDLTGFAVHPKEEILIHVLDPSRSVEGNYRSYVAKLADGRVLTGLLTAESKTTIEILDAENKRFTLQRPDLDELTESTKSLMPEGFEKQITAVEMTDLLEFLTQKGKYVPIPLDKFATVLTTRGMFYDVEGVAERLVFEDWKPKEFKGVPFILTDPQDDKHKNAILLYGPNGNLPKTMPKTVVLPCNTPAKAIHLLSGIGGWSHPASRAGTVSLIARLHYADGKTEDHPLKNGIHFADYIRKVDVPESEYAFKMKGGQQVRYLSITPKRPDVIKTLELLKGPDATAPIVMAVTIETP